MINRFSAAMVRLADKAGAAHDVSDLYEAALDALVDVTGITRASILLFDADGVMRFKVWRGISDVYRAAVEGHTPWTPGQAPPDPIVVPDASADASLASYGDTFRAERIAALAFIPIVSRGGVIGKFMLYRDAPGPFEDFHVATALNIGYQIGIAAVTTKAMREEAAAREQLALLTEASEKLVAATSHESVVEEVLRLAQRVISADGYAIWRLNGDVWSIAASEGVSDEFARISSHQRPSDPFDGPVIAPDVTQSARLDARRDVYEREGIVSLVSVPLAIRGGPGGGISFYYRTPHTPSAPEVRVATALGHLAAAAITNAELRAEQERLRRDAQDAELRSLFLAEASAVLSSLDYERNLQRLADLMVPRLADWCAVDLLTDRGTLERPAIAHVDPAKVALAREFERRYPTQLEAATGVARVLRTAKPELHRDITDEMLVAAARDAEHLGLMRELGLQSAMIVPLATRRRMLGALTFVTVRGGRRYGDEDLAFAKELARRAALALENAGLYAEAQEANRLKDEFLATLSHELRTPLNVILGRTRMLAGDTGDGAHAPLVATIERNAQALARLVDDLLDVSRISLGKVSVDTQPVSLAAIIETVVAGLEPAARAKGIAIVTNVALPVPLVAGDAMRLQQVVWNLLTNAIKFTSAGGRVTIALTRTDGELHLSVSDTGEGIPPDFLPHVFDMFRQGEAAANRRYGGLGLGLSIVRQLVELHGGTIVAESAGAGRGATFRVSLPVARTASVV